MINDDIILNNINIPIYEINPRDLAGIQQQCLMYKNKYYYINEKIDFLTRSKLILNEPFYTNNEIYESMLNNILINTQRNNRIDTIVGVWIILKLVNKSTQEIQRNIYFLESTYDEFLTKHILLVYHIQILLNEEYDIFLQLAGEMEIRENTIKFNYLSGTYMRDILTDYNVDDKEKLVTETITFFKDKINPDIDYIYDDSMDTFLTEEKLPLTPYYLMKLIDGGIEIIRFLDKEDCLKMSKYELELSKYTRRLEIAIRTHKRIDKHFNEEEFIKDYKIKNPEPEDIQGEKVTIQMLEHEITGGKYKNRKSNKGKKSKKSNNKGKNRKKHTKTHKK